jgi:ribulose-5-phosphate 4-epimerase/fuculose-1-phosphate aldolase
MNHSDSTMISAGKGVRDLVSFEEWQLRCELAAAYRLVAHFGWDDLVFTHLSVRVPGPEHHFLLNPYQLMFREITASSLVKVDVDGNPVMDGPYSVNAAGFTIHSAIHMARKDAHAVIHLHTPHGQAVSAMRDGLMPHTQTAMTILGDLAYHDYEGLAVDLDERDRLVADMGTKNCMILRNHGTLTVGQSVGSAFLRMHLLERACQAQIHMLAGGHELLGNPPQGAPEKVAAQASAAELEKLSQAFVWDALMRQADHDCPGFRV